MLHWTLRDIQLHIKIFFFFYFRKCLLVSCKYMYIVVVETKLVPDRSGLKSCTMHSNFFYMYTFCGRRWKFLQCENKQTMTKKTVKLAFNTVKSTQQVSSIVMSSRLRRMNATKQRTNQSTESIFGKYETISIPIIKEWNWTLEACTECCQFKANIISVFVTVIFLQLQCIVLKSE